MKEVVLQVDDTARSIVGGDMPEFESWLGVKVVRVRDLPNPDVVQTFEMTVTSPPPLHRLASVQIEVAMKPGFDLRRSFQVKETT